MSIKSQKSRFVAINVSVPVEQKEEALKKMRLHGYATLSEYIRGLIRNDTGSKVAIIPGMISEQNENLNYPRSVNEVLGTLELFELAKKMQIAKLIEQNPEASDREINIMLGNWVRHKPGAPYGDASGEPNFKRIKEIFENGSAK